jgi:RNA polymerase sigma-70 factor (ECF subfamily)
MGAAMTAASVPRGRRPSDDELLASLGTEDLSSLGVLFHRYALDVRRFIARLGVAPGDVDDLTQTTFLIVLDVASRYRGNQSARSWLFGLAVNAVRQHRRMSARIARKLAAWSREPHPAPVRTLSESLEQREDSARATRALARLSPKKREVFVMVVMEGVPAETTADALGIPVGTVWTRLHHARLELRAYLAEDSR